MPATMNNQKQASRDPAEARRIARAEKNRKPDRDDLEALFPGMPDCVADCETDSGGTIERAEIYAAAMKDPKQRAGKVYLDRVAAFCHQQWEASAQSPELRKQLRQNRHLQLVTQMKNDIYCGRGMAPVLVTWMGAVKEPATDPLPAVIMGNVGATAQGAKISPAEAEAALKRGFDQGYAAGMAGDSKLAEQRKALEARVAATNAELAVVKATAAAKGITLNLPGEPESPGGEMSAERREELLNHTAAGRLVLKSSPNQAVAPKPVTEAKHSAPKVDQDTTPLTAAVRRALLMQTPLGHAILQDEARAAGGVVPCVGSVIDGPPISESRRREMLSGSAVGRSVLASEDAIAKVKEKPPASNDVMTPDRRAQLLGCTSLGSAILRSEQVA